MKEIEVKQNNSDYKVYSDEDPIFNLIPTELLKIFITALEIEITDIIKAKEQRRKYYSSAKTKNSTKKVPP